jgi:hypothetical protein
MTITIENILDDITEQAKLHDEFIGFLLKKYNLPEDGTAKTSEYDEPMTNVLVELSDDIELRFNHIMAKYRVEDLDENAKIWLEGVKKMIEALEEVLKEIDNKEEYENVPFDTHANRDAMEETYVNEHETFEAMHKGAKTILLLSMLDGLGMSWKERG